MPNSPTLATLKEVLASTSDVLFPEQLGDAPVSIDSADCDGDTPLHVMVWREDLLAIETLIAAGANVNAVGDMGETPLHIAVGKQNMAVVNALMSSGARTDITSEFGETAGERALKLGGEIAKVVYRAVGA